jgi:hypothetical protein
VWSYSPITQYRPWRWLLLIQADENAGENASPCTHAHAPTDIKELKQIAAKTAAANNILSAKVKAHERNAKRRTTVLGGGKKRKMNWDVQTGQGYDDQYHRLKRVVGELFHEDVPHEYVMGLMADTVVHSKEGRAALEKTMYMKKREKAIEQDAVCTSVRHKVVCAAVEVLAAEERGCGSGRGRRLHEAR